MHRHYTNGYAQPSGGPSSSAEPCVCIDVPPDANPHLDRFLVPQGRDAGTQACRVRVADKMTSMHLEDGNGMMLAARQKGKDWLICTTSSCADTTVVARLRSHKDGTWTCVRERKNSRTEGWESLVVRHATHSVSESLPELNVLSGALPPDCVLATEFELLCELPPGELASRLRQAEEGRRAAPTNQLLEIVTKLPKWNGRTQSFELAFHGRAKLASERNLQLVERFPQDKERLLLLCGKLDEEEYALDFAHPLSPVHAFAFFLCTSSW
mmetsp:Transcript_6551/g.13146  ORF Transcript_6551/g.13146 Transcript_6551/m.13146 type:complete len:269 (+) Transcript_6551:72-878(+)